MIEKVLKTTDCLKVNPKPTPTRVERPLGTDKKGPPSEGKWKYDSVIGMLMYLASNSKLDIAFAVHQCARFTHCTKRSHEQAVIQICRYLKGTINDGLIFKPTKDLRVDLFCDADFAGLWGAEDPQDPVCVKSRTRYISLLFSIK